MSASAQVIAIVPPTAPLVSVPGGWWRAVRTLHMEICPHCGRDLEGRALVRYEAGEGWRMRWPCSAGCNDHQAHYVAAYHVRELGPWLPAYEPHEVAV